MKGQQAGPLPGGGDVYALDLAKGTARGDEGSPGTVEETDAQGGGRAAASVVRRAAAEAEDEGYPLEDKPVSIAIREVADGKVTGETVPQAQ